MRRRADGLEETKAGGGREEDEGADGQEEEEGGGLAWFYEVAVGRAPPLPSAPASGALPTSGSGSAEEANELSFYETLEAVPASCVEPRGQVKRGS